MKTLWLTALSGAFLVASAMGGCGGDDPDPVTSDATGSGPGNGGSGGDVFVGSGGGGTCVGLECKQVDCDGDVTTTLSATVYDPSGTLPLHGVVAYVPNADVGPIDDGLTCDQCDADLSGDPVVTAITDTQGRFVLEDVPVVDDLPIVLQVGKWRRIVTVSTVEACVDNNLEDPETFRLPRSRAEGNLPRIALTTGSYDPLFCLLRRMGIADEEFGVEGSDARIHFYHGVNGSTAFDGGFGSSPGATFPDATDTLWAEGWENYDIVMLSCEGDEYVDSKTGHRDRLKSYIDDGGRVFATHYHYAWLDRGDAPADLASVAEFQSTQVDHDGEVDIDISFPKGEALADWLDFVDGSSAYSHFDVVDGRLHTTSIDPSLARSWVTADEDIMYFSFNAPVGAAEDQQCGRMVFSDIHISASAGDPDGAFPSTCNDEPLTEQEKALIFMFFDLSSCIQDDDAPITPPS
jgi:hypothetical protein